MEKISGIYGIKNKVNNKTYIGKSSINIWRRLSNHKNRLIKNNHINKHLQHAWNKYGEINFEFYLIEKCKPDECANKETFYIELYKSNQENFGYNKTRGGDGCGHPVSEKTREKISKSHIGIKPTEESKQKNREWHFGRKQSKETIEKRRKSMFGKNIGRKIGDESKRKMAQAKIGKKQSKETIKKRIDKVQGIPRKNGTSSSKYVGVYWDVSKWRAEIHFKGKKIYCGSSKNEVQAAKMYDKKAIELYGKSANLNFPS